MNTSIAAIDVVRTNDVVRTYASTTSRAVALAARTTARAICEKLTTQRAALAACERLFDAAYTAKTTTTDATARESAHERCVVLAVAYNVVLDNDARVLRKTLARDVARRASE